jgi:hypothetical protein
MRSALYYPHTQIKSKQLFKTALLLWDRVTVITPWEHYIPNYDDPSVAEAFAIIGKCHHPSSNEKKRAHELVEDFLSRPLPPAFSYMSVDGAHNSYDIYPQKMLPETVHLLRKRGMSVAEGRRNMRASSVTGLSLMNIIADCCAGRALVRITDEGAAYASLAGLLVDEVDEADNELAVEQARERLLPIPLRIVDIKCNFEDLVDLRRREEASAEGSKIRSLRHSFVDKVEEHARRLAAAESDLARMTLEEEFQTEMQDDYRDLREALKTKAEQVIGTKEVITAVLAAGAVAAAIFCPQLPVAEAVSGLGGAATIGGLFSTKSKFAEERRKILKDHPIAYLYEASGRLRL